MSCQRTEPKKVPSANRLQADATPAPVMQIPKMEILYVKFPPDRQGTCLCILSMPANNTQNLLDDPKVGSRLGKVMGSAVFSPDGKSILFAASDAKSPVGITEGGTFGELLDLWSLNRKTLSLTTLTTDSQGYDSLSWSPDGRYVGALGLKRYITGESPPTESGAPEYDLYVLEPSKGNRWLVGRQVERYHWKEKTPNIVWTGESSDSGLHLKTWEPLTAKVRHVLDGIGEDATWAPNSKGILFTWFASRTINLVNPSTERIQTICPVTDRVFFQQWSPDGARVVYWSPDESKLALLSLVNRTRDDIASGADDFSCAWSHDSKRLAVAYHGTVQNVETYYTTLALIPMTTKQGNVLSAFTDDAKILGWTKDNSTIIILHSPYKRENVGRSSALIALPQQIVAVDVSTGDKQDVASLPPNVQVTDWRLVDSE